MPGKLHYCKIFKCKHLGDNTCCTYCQGTFSCDDACLNGPERCGQYYETTAEDIAAANPQRPLRYEINFETVKGLRIVASRQVIAETIGVPFNTFQYGIVHRKMRADICEKIYAEYGVDITKDGIYGGNEYAGS